MVEEVGGPCSEVTADEKGKTTTCLYRGEARQKHVFSSLFKGLEHGSNSLECQRASRDLLMPHQPPITLCSVFCRQTTTIRKRSKLPSMNFPSDEHFTKGQGEKGQSQNPRREIHPMKEEPCTICHHLHGDRDNHKSTGE